MSSMSAKLIATTAQAKLAAAVAESNPSTVARRVGSTGNTIRLLVAGAVRPNAKTIERMRVIGITPSDWFQPVESVTPKTPAIEFADFAKLDIRVGKIETAERVPKSKKLIKLGVYFGDEIGRRVILAGIGGNPEFAIDTLINYHALFVVNLPPKAMFEVESHGMILAATGADGQSHIATCGSPVPGAKVG